LYKLFGNGIGTFEELFKFHFIIMTFIAVEDMMNKMERKKKKKKKDKHHSRTLDTSDLDATRG
jgi:hypothetical protein